MSINNSMLYSRGKFEMDIETRLPLRRKLRSDCNSNNNNYCCECFNKYSSSTSIHGIKYVGEVNRPICERIFWIIVLLTSVCVCSQIIYNLWKKWNDTPVIVSFDNRETDIWKIPFPSVTICPQTKSNISLFSYDEAYQKQGELTTEENDFLKALTNVCELKEHIKESEDFENNDELDVIGLLNTLLPRDKETYVEFSGKYSRLNELVTSEGICFNFNQLKLSDIYTDDCEYDGLNNSLGLDSDWTREDGYDPQSGVDAYPRRILGSGVKRGLDIVLMSSNKGVDNLCSIPPNGYKVLIHLPDNIPPMSTNYFTLPANQHVVVAVKPNMMWTSDNLRYYSVEKRQCYFDGERFLKYFKIYSQDNCNLECLTNFTYHQCKCIKFSMPKHRGIRICSNFSEILCYMKAEEIFSTLEIDAELKKDSYSGQGKKNCDCLPSCTTIMYNTEISQSNVDFAKVIQLFNNTTNSNKYENIMMSRLTIFFKESSFFSSKRSQLYGISEFVANCGGLLGLFMGVSVLSIVEICYFSTIRVFSDTVQRRWERRSQN